MSVHPWFQTMFDLSQTTSPVELWTALLIPHGADTSWEASEPYALFRRMYVVDSTYVLITALLLCTDHRWRGAAYRLIRQLSGSGMLDEHDLIRLSEWFMAVGVHVCAPRRLFPRGRAVSVVDVAVRDCAVQDDAPASSGLAESPTVHPALVDSLSAEVPVVELPVDEPTAGGAATNRRASMVRIARPVWPALKRWAAAHQVRSGTRSWDELFAFAAGLRESDSAALLAGVMDATDALPPIQREAAVEAGMASRHRSVRLAALPVVASLHGIDEAIRRASDDPSASVRAWATSASRPNRSKRFTPNDAAGPGETPPVDQSEQIQPTLF